MPARILIVDDEPSLLRLTEYNLKREGYEVLTADSGQKALAMVAQEHPDLVVLDVMLPDISGQEVCRRLREAPETADLPVIMLSARVQVADRIQGIKAGADEYVTKPVDSDELLARIEGLLRRLQGPRQDPGEASRGRVLAVWGARGGSGATTVAAGTALALAEAGRDVILADLLPGFGTLGSSLGIDSPAGGPGVFESEVSAEAVRLRLVEHPSGLRVLTHPRSIGLYREPEPSQVAALVEALAGAASLVVLDLSGHGFGLSGLVSHLDAVYVVANPDPESIELAGRRVELLARWGVSQDAVGAVIVSRLAPLRLSLEQLDRQLQPLLGCPVVGAIPPSYELLIRQQAIGGPGDGEGTADPFVSSLEELSRRLVEDAPV